MFDATSLYGNRNEKCCGILFHNELGLPKSHLKKILAKSNSRFVAIQRQNIPLGSYLKAKKSKHVVITACYILLHHQIILSDGV